MEKLIKYLKILDRWVIGVILELIYTLITFSAAAILCCLFYFIAFIKK